MAGRLGPSRPPNVPARIRFGTESGSVYEVDNREPMWWRRVSATLASGQLRSADGPLDEDAEPVVGHPCYLIAIDNPYLPGTARIVITTRVVWIEIIDP